MTNPIAALRRLDRQHYLYIAVILAVLLRGDCRRSMGYRGIEVPQDAPGPASAHAAVTTRGDPFLTTTVCS